MPDDPNDTPTPKKDDEGKTFTQADIDRIVADRLSREKNKYSDYEDLKAKAEKFDQAEAANKSEADKLRDENEALKAKVSAGESKALRAQIAMEKGLTAAQAKRLVGSTQEELEADADEILEAFPSQGGGTKPPPTTKPVADLQGGNDPTGDEAPDISKIVESIPRL